MAQLARKTLQLFGGTAASTEIGQFGSKEAGFPVTSTDPAVIQALSAWGLGWSAAIITANKAPYKQDMNGVMYVFGYELAYIFQSGLPEWDSATTYYTGSLVRDPGTGDIYKSKINNNTGNALPAQTDDANWEYRSRPVVVGGVTNTIPKVGANISQVVMSSITDDGLKVSVGEPLSVAGQIESTSGGFKFPDATVQTTASVVPVGTVLQSILGSFNGSLTDSNTIPDNNSAPTTSNGSLLMSQAITPKAAGNKIQVRALVPMRDRSAGNNRLKIALFQSGSNNAIAVGVLAVEPGDGGMLECIAEFIAPSTAPITFSIRFGGSSFSEAGGSFGGANYGGTLLATLHIQEIKS